MPNQEGISWESHLLGAIAGIIVSAIFKGVEEEGEVTKSVWEEPDAQEKPYLPRDTFEKTKAQRHWEQEQIRLAEQQARDGWNTDTTLN